eukprot:13139440-Heterocapsa_arctica.AAC.1
MYKLAENDKLLSGRQQLLFLYLEFKQDGHQTHAIAYVNLEHSAFIGDGRRRSSTNFNPAH